MEFYPKLVPDSSAGWLLATGWLAATFFAAPSFLGSWPEHSRQHLLFRRFLEKCDLLSTDSHFP